MKGKMNVNSFIQKNKHIFQICLVFVLISSPALLYAQAATAQPSQTAPQNSDQQQSDVGKELISSGTYFFVPHMYVQGHFGLAYDVGEASFGQLLSPALQVGLGYQFNEYFGLRGSVNGAWARNRYAYPEAKYSWNFIQGTLDAQLDLTTLLLGCQPDRQAHLYAFAGFGANFAFNNDEAVEADKRWGIDFKKLWHETRWSPALRFGLAFDYFLNERLAVGAEVQANMLPDHFNSKLGRSDNRDWHMNALVGVKYTLGPRYGRTEAQYREIPKPVEPKTQFVDVPIEKISFNVNIYFLMNQSVIRSNQIEKLQRLLRYLDQHPRAFVRLSGYADRETGNSTINLRLSRERAQVVSQYLEDAGLPEWRIRRFAKGDRVQPYDVPSENRVCICYVYDPDNPIRQDNW